jgi:transcription-repair coupling factor (superfamily II helicase)
VKLVQQQHKIYKLDGKDKLRFIRELSDVEKRASAVEELLTEISIDK